MLWANVSSTIERTTSNQEVVARVEAALGRGEAVRLGRWLAMPTGARLGRALARGPTPRDSFVGGEPDDVFWTYWMKHPQNADCGVYESNADLAQRIVRCWFAD